MKRLLALLIFALVIYVIYIDLSKGTLPGAVETSIKAQNEAAIMKESDMKYFEIEVKSGDTVLSIIENQLDSSVSVPIQQVIDDFRSLNSGIEAEKIQIGKTYKFPDYQ